MNFLGVYIFLGIKEYNCTICLGTDTEGDTVNRRILGHYICQVTDKYTWQYIHRLNEKRTWQLDEFKKFVPSTLFLSPAPPIVLTFFDFEPAPLPSACHRHPSFIITTTCPLSSSNVDDLPLAGVHAPPLARPGSPRQRQGDYFCFLKFYFEFD
jgi:hypothetical protein